MTKILNSNYQNCLDYLDLDYLNIVLNIRVSYFEFYYFGFRISIFGFSRMLGVLFVEVEHRQFESQDNTPLVLLS